MLRVRSHDFTRDERGAGTIMGLLWFMLLVGITGMAIDVTNGFRNRTMLQATADAAALGGVIDVLNSAAVASAIVYSTSNMPGAMYGDVLLPEDVEVGSWNAATRTFIEGGLVVNILDPDGPMVPDAVKVTLHQTVANTNAVPVNFLRIVGLQTWDVNVEAVAQRFIPECLMDGLIADGIVDMSSLNAFTNNICIHGQQGMRESIDNTHQIGVTISTPSMYDDTIGIIVPADKYDHDPGLIPAMREQSLRPRMVNHVDDIMNAMLNLERNVVPSFITGTTTGDFNGVTAIAPLPSIEEKGWDWDFVTVPGHIYHIKCAANKNATIPGGTHLTDVVIISDCNIGTNSGGGNAGPVVMSNVVLNMLSTGNPGGNDNDNGNDNGGTTSGHGGAGVEKATLDFAGEVQLGTSDCSSPDGGVQIFSNASVHFSSKTEIHGLQIVAAGNVNLGTLGMGIEGINVQAGGNITLNSQNQFGLCPNSAPNLQTVAYYRLVR